MPSADSQGFGGSILNAVSGSTPWGAIAQLGGGLIQSIIGGGRARKAQRELEHMVSPAYTRNQGILDYYSKALSKYNTSPYESALYKKSVNDTQRSQAYGLDALRGRGGAVAGVSNIVAAGNDNLLKAAANAEQQHRQDFNTLGTATNMKAGEDMKDYQYNKLAPFERKYNLTAMKAGGGNKVLGAGLSNIFGGFNAYNDYNQAQKILG